jgi:hypothetical protein
MKNILEISLVILIALFTKPVHSQFYIGTGAGVYVNSPNIVEMSVSNAKGFVFRAGYIYSITKKIGIGSGIEFARFSQTVTTESNLNYTTFLIDGNNSAFEYRLKTTDYLEKQRLQSLQVPVFLQFKILMEKDTYFYVRGGIKYMMPQKFTALASAARVESAGFYPDFNVLITDLPTRGFGAIDGYNQSTTYKTQDVLMGSFEIGFSFSMAKKGALYAGIYFDKATSSIITNESDRSFIGYNPKVASDKPLNGLFSTKTTTEVRPLNLGLSLSYSFE